MTIKFSDISQYSNLGLIAKQLVEGGITGIHRSPYHGFSVEFAEHKLYNYGESTKHIDWKVFGRTDRLYTRNFEEETNLRCRILLDCSSSMHYPNPEKSKLKFSVFGAAALAYLLAKQRDLVGISTFSSKINHETHLGSTKAHLAQLFELLEKILENENKNEETNIVKILHETAEKIPKKSLIILFTDMYQYIGTEELFQGLHHLRHRGHEVILFHVSDYKSEKELNFTNRPHKFIDAETGESIVLNPDQIRASYQEEVASFYQLLKIRCGSMGIDFIPVDTNGDFNSILSNFLVMRKKMS